MYKGLIKDICNHCINEYCLITETLDSNVENLEYDDVINKLRELNDEMFQYYKRILKYLDKCE